MCKPSGEIDWLSEVKSMSATTSVANDVVSMLDRFKEETSKATGKDKSSYSDAIRLLFARQRGQQGNI